MEIIERKHARAAGLNKYYTGKPCKNGHVDFRYVQSGTCKSCINGDHLATDPGIVAAVDALKQAKLAAALRLQEEDAKRKATAVALANEQRASISARVAAKAALVVVRVRCYDEDVEILKASLFALALARSPALMVGDIWPGLLPVDKASGTAIYKVNCHPSDVAMLQEVANALLRAKAPDVEAARRQIFTALQEATPAAPVPGWADRP